MINPAAPVEPFAPALQPNGGVSARSTAASPAPPPAPADLEAHVREAVAAINRATKALNNSVELSIDTSSGDAIVRVIDSETGQLIRQIPSEEVLDLRRALDRIAGLLIRQTA